MKKLMIMLLVAMLALTAAATAETYRHDDLTFEYDAAAFEITSEDHTDDEDLVLLGFKNAEWGEGYVRIHLRDMKDGETFPTLDDFKDVQESLNAPVEQMETWANFKNVITYEAVSDDVHETVFVAPAMEKDGEIDDILTVSIGVTSLDDEETGMLRDDALSDLVNSIQIIDD